VDIPQTVLAAAGADPGVQESDGVDLAEVASGTCKREMVYNHFDGFGFVEELGTGACVWEDGEAHLEDARYAIYTAIGERFKYAYSAGDNQEFLFDLQEDPQETQNLAGTPPCRETLRALRRSMMCQLQASGRTEGLEGNRWRTFPGQQMSPDPDAGLLVQDHPWTNPRIPGYSQ